MAHSARLQASPAGEDLGRLLAAEDGIAAHLAAARAEAERLVAEAVQRVEDAERDLERACDQALAKVQAEANAERDAQVRAIEFDAARRVQALDGVTDATIAQVADRVFLQLLASDGAVP